MVRFLEVGGCVRDARMGIPTKDVDFAVEGVSSFEEMVTILEDMGFELFETRPEFVTVRAKVPTTMPELLSRTKVADFVVCRKDSSETDGRRPLSVEPGTIFDDLARRDFTVNAIAFDPFTGEFIDPHNGMVDIERRELRFVGNPFTRIEEDGLRVLRGFRFHITKGFSFTPETRDALHSEVAARMLHKVSVERIRDELNKMFVCDTLATLKLFSEFSDELVAAIFRDGLRLDSTMKKG